MKKPDPLIGQRKHQKASLILAHSRAIPAKMRGWVREVLEVYTEPGFRGLGYASKLVANVVEEADKHRMLLLVFPKPYRKPFETAEGLSVDGLTKMYEAHGFEITQTKPVLMLARQPMTPAMRKKFEDDSRLTLESTK